jgi:hypothetical protein
MAKIITGELILKLLNDSISQLVPYRRLQAINLQRRLDVFTKIALDKYGSIDDVKEQGYGAINSKQDVDIIKYMINIESFVTIPGYNDSNEFTHFYTIGSWYYWGIPELVIRFTNPLKEKPKGIENIICLIHDELFAMYQNNILSKNNLERIDFNQEPDTISVNLQKLNLNFDINKLPQDDYIGANLFHMLWFYMYYMEAIKDENDEPQLYPVYTITIDNDRYDEIQKDLGSNLFNIVNEYMIRKETKIEDLDNSDEESIESDLSDLSDDSDILSTIEEESDPDPESDDNNDCTSSIKKVNN